MTTSSPLWSEERRAAAYLAGTTTGANVPVYPAIADIEVMDGRIIITVSTAVCREPSRLGPAHRGRRQALQAPRRVSVGQPRPKRKWSGISKKSPAPARLVTLAQASAYLIRVYLIRVSACQARKRGCPPSHRSPSRSVRDSRNSFQIFRSSPARPWPVQRSSGDDQALSRSTSPPDARAPRRKIVDPPHPPRQLGVRNTQPQRRQLRP